MANNVLTESDISFFEEDEREEVHIYNEKGEIENLEPKSRKVKSQVPPIRPRGKCGKKEY